MKPEIGFMGPLSTKDILDDLNFVVKNDFDCFEIPLDWKQNYNLNPKIVKEIRDISINHGISLIVHTPYYLPTSTMLPEIKKGVIENVKKSAELGLVLATDNHASNTVILCSCCECCCGMLRGICEFDNPRAIAKSNFVAQVDKDACIGCETCLSRCKFGAIIVDTTAEIDSQKCMGCGLCAVTCPEKALSMKRLDREEIPGLEA